MNVDVEACIRYYNQVRLHTAKRNLSPIRFENLKKRYPSLLDQNKESLLAFMTFLLKTSNTTGPRTAGVGIQRRRLLSNWLQLPRRNGSDYAVTNTWPMWSPALHLQMALRETLISNRTPLEML